MTNLDSVKQDMFNVAIRIQAHELIEKHTGITEWQADLQANLMHNATSIKVS